MTDAELAALLDDEGKRIDGDLSWSEDEDHSIAVELQAAIDSDAGYPLLAKGRYNPVAGTLSFSMIHRGVGRILGLDLGTAHHNPSCHTVPGAHWQVWSERFGTKDAEAAPGLDTFLSDPATVWQIFCARARIRHAGQLRPPPPRPREL